MVKAPTFFDIVGRIPAADLGRAAKALGLTPTALLRRVESLESALGVKLVDTATRALKPGEAGRLMIDHASRIFSQARDLTREEFLRHAWAWKEKHHKHIVAQLKKLGCSLDWTRPRAAVASYQQSQNPWC